MPNISMPNGQNAVKYYFLAFIVLLFDQVTKYYFNATFTLYQTVDVLPPVLNWTLAYNHGAAFSFLADQNGWQKWFFCNFGPTGNRFCHRPSKKNPKICKSTVAGFGDGAGRCIGQCD